MREILFRGKRTDNGEWAEGHLYVTHKGTYEIGYYSAATNIERLIYIVDPNTVGQFTGLLDKNGKRIFEGDVCRVSLIQETSVGKIVWDDRIASFVILFADGMCLLFLDLFKYKDNPDVWIEVISNIHDNPELLGGGGADG